MHVTNLMYEMVGHDREVENDAKLTMRAYNLASEASTAWRIAAACDFLPDEHIMTNREDKVG